MRARLLLIALAPLVAAGCGNTKINESKTLTLDMKTPANGLLIPAQKQPAKLTVEFSSSDKDVTVCVFKESDIKTDDDMTSVSERQALAHTRGKEGTLTADVPENTATRVVVRQHAAPKTDVKVTVTSGP